MIRVICAKCQARHEYPDSNAGRIATCLDCKASIIVPSAGTEEWQNDSRDPGVIERSEPVTVVAAKSVLLITAIVAACCIVFFGIIALTKARKEPPPKTPEQVRYEKHLTEAERKQEEESLKAGISVIVAGIVLVVVCGWLFAVYSVGAWVARDAYQRGMNGLAWTCFYFAFQIINRLALGGVWLAVKLLAAGIIFKDGTPSAFESVAYAPLWALILASEAIHWGGLFVYLYCRRRGSMRRCRDCRESHLSTLQRCPHCLA